VHWSFFLEKQNKNQKTKKTTKKTRCAFILAVPDLLPPADFLRDGVDDRRQGRLGVDLGQASLLGDEGDKLGLL